MANEDLGSVAPGWWIHIVGPDDLIPAPDELTALRQANEFNVASEKQRREFQNDSNYPYSIAVVRFQFQD